MRLTLCYLNKGILLRYKLISTDFELDILVKTVERAVAIRFGEPSELHKILPHHQSVDRLSHSTETADDTQMIEQTTIPGIPGTIMKLQCCIEATQEWCKSRWLQLNPVKTELIRFGSKANLKKMADLDLNLYIGADVIKPRSVSFVTLQRTLSMCHHINTVVRSWFFHLRRLKSVRRSSVLRLPQAWCQPTRLDNKLLKLSSRRPSTIDDWSTSTCSECGGQTCCRNKNSGPHHSSPPEPTLASDQVPHYLQALRAQAPGASCSQPCIPVGHDDIRRWPAWSWETEILQQLPIWTFTVETKVRRA